MKLSDERSRDCNSLEIEIERFVNISLVPCNEHNKVVNARKIQLHISWHLDEFTFHNTN